MNRFIKPRAALQACLFAAGCAAPLLGDIKLVQEPGQADAPWQSSYGGGSLAAFTQPRSAAEAVAEPMEGWNYFAQSITGNGQYLTGFAFYGAGFNSPPVTYTISVLSYGPVSGPIDSVPEFNPSKPAGVLASASYVLGKSTDGKLYFEFSGEDRVFLQQGYGYVLLLAPDAKGNANFYRMTNGAFYPGGACARGSTVLSPGVFNKNGEDRDAVFALYTTP